MILGTDGRKDAEWNIKLRHSPNNMVLIQGKPGMGKTLLNCELVNGASNDGVPSVVFDWSDSYNASMFPKEKLTYFDVSKEGLGINPFKRQTQYIDENPVPEDDDLIVYRIVDILEKGMGIKGMEQIATVQKHLFNMIENDGPAASFPYLYVLLGNNPLAERLRCLAKSTLYSEKLNWKKILQPGKILVVQLSKINAHLRYLFAELILSDLWNETKSGNLGDYLLCLDEIQHMRMDRMSVMQNMLRESRKYAVAMLLATQFIGDITDKGARLALEQAAQRIYFNQAEKSITATAKCIDNVNYLRWKPILRELDKFEFVFVGNVLVDGKPQNLRCKLKFAPKLLI